MRNLISGALLGMVVATPMAKAQSLFLDSGENGTVISGAFSSGDGFNGVGAHAGYCMGGMLDLTMGVNRFSLDDSDVTAITISPGLGVDVVEPSGNGPLGLQLMASYVRSSYSGESLDFFGLDMSQSGFGLGAHAYLHIQSSDTVDIFPYAGITYVSYETRIEGTGFSLTEDYDSTPFSFGLSFLMNNGFLLDGAVQIDDGDTAFSIGAGLLLSSGLYPAADGRL